METLCKWNSFPYSNTYRKSTKPQCYIVYFPEFTNSTKYNKSYNSKSYKNAKAHKKVLLNPSVPIQTTEYINNIQKRVVSTFKHQNNPRMDYTSKQQRFNIQTTI